MHPAFLRRLEALERKVENLLAKLRESEKKQIKNQQAAKELAWNPGVKRS